METSKIRNVAVIGPHAAGKTTLVEALLYDMAVIPSRGRVEAGSTTTDFDPEAIAREMSVGTGVAWGPYQDVTIHLLDTPGHGDFQVETRLALAAADAAILVIDATKGVDGNVEKHYRQAKAAGLPILVFLNAVEADGAIEYAELLRAIREQLDPHAVPLELPVGRGKRFNGDVDLVGMRTWYFAPETGEVTEVPETPSELADEVGRYHTELVEAVAELDDALLERYLGGDEPTGPELWAALRRDLADGTLLPVMCGSARENLGTRPLLDAIVELLPSPADRRYPALVDSESGAAEPLSPDPEGPAAAVIFKTLADPYLGKISVFRVLRGTLAADSQMTDPRRGASERLGRLFKLVGKKPVPVDQLAAGEIGAVAKLKDAATGDTLVAGHHPRPLAFPMPALPPAIWSVAIAPEAKADENKLAVSLAKLREEDPALSVSTEPRTHRTVLSGQGPRHLEVAIARLENRYHLAVSQSEPQIPYRETIRGQAQGQGRHKKQTGGRGQFGDVWLKIEPLPRGDGFRFVDAVVGGAVPRNFIPAVEKGVRETLEGGLLAGYPIVDVQVTLYDGSSHSVDSSEVAFKTAAHLALRKIFAEADPVLLEPVMDIAVRVPAEALGDAMADLNTRRAAIAGMNDNVIHAQLPLAELAGLVTALQGYTRGQGTVESSFHGYEEVPAHLVGRVLTALKAQAEAS